MIDGDPEALSRAFHNLLDNDHYEAFGGNLLGRRALVSLTYSW